MYEITITDQEREYYGSWTEAIAARLNTTECRIWLDSVTYYEVERKALIRYDLTCHPQGAWGL